MKEEFDLEGAVAAGIIGEDQAIALRNREALEAGTPRATQEKFALFGGLADCTIAIGASLLLFGTGKFCWSYHETAPLFAMTGFGAIVAFQLGFARSRRTAANNPALASVLLLGSSIFSALLTDIIVTQLSVGTYDSETFYSSLKFLTGSATAFLFWRISRFPPAPALAWLFFLFALVVMSGPILTGQHGHESLKANLCAAGVGGLMLSFALLNDLSDIRRETSRSQVAFWLHLAAGFVLTNAAIGLILGSHWLDLEKVKSLRSDYIAPYMTMFVPFSVLAIALDRRSFLLGSVIPMVVVLKEFGNGSLGLIFAGTLLVGFTLGWHRLREKLLAKLPQIVAAQLPRTALTHQTHRPTRQRFEFQRRRRG